MAEAKDIKLAKEVFAAVCQRLEEDEWSFKKDETKLEITCGAQGDDLPMDINIQVDADRSLVLLLSPMPFTVPEDKRLDVVVAVSAINNILADGCFDFSIVSGRLFFRMTNSFCDSLIGKEVFAYMLYTACATIDKFNDKFFMLTKGMLSLENFLSVIKD